MKQNNRGQIVDKFYSQDIVCKEPEHAIAMGVPTITTGLDAVKTKSKARDEMIEVVHAEYCTEPVFFSVALGRDITLKGKTHMNCLKLVCLK